MIMSCVTLTDLDSTGWTMSQQRTPNYHGTAIYHRQVFCPAERPQSTAVLGKCSWDSETLAPPDQLPLHTCKNTADPESAFLHHLRSSAAAEKSSCITQHNTTASASAASRADTLPWDAILLACIVITVELALTHSQYHKNNNNNKQVT